MASFSNKNADLLNVVNKNRKLAAWDYGTLLKKLGGLSVENGLLVTTSVYISVGIIIF